MKSPIKLAPFSTRRSSLVNSNPKHNKEVERKDQSYLYPGVTVAAVIISLDEHLIALYTDIPYQGEDETDVMFYLLLNSMLELSLTNMDPREYAGLTQNEWALCQDEYWFLARNSLASISAIMNEEAPRKMSENVVDFITTVLSNHWKIINQKTYEPSPKEFMSTDNMPDFPSSSLRFATDNAQYLEPSTRTTQTYKDWTLFPNTKHLTIEEQVLWAVMNGADARRAFWIVWIRNFFDFRENHLIIRGLLLSSYVFNSTEVKRYKAGLVGKCVVAEFGELIRANSARISLIAEKKVLFETALAAWWIDHITINTGTLTGKAIRTVTRLLGEEELPDTCPFMNAAFRDLFAAVDPLAVLNWAKSVLTKDYKVDEKNVPKVYAYRQVPIGLKWMDLTNALTLAAFQEVSSPDIREMLASAIVKSKYVIDIAKSDPLIVTPARNYLYEEKDGRITNWETKLPTDLFREDYVYMSGLCATVYAWMKAKKPLWDKYLSNFVLNSPPTYSKHLQAEMAVWETYFSMPDDLSEDIPFPKLPEATKKRSDEIMEICLDKTFI